MSEMYAKNLEVLRKTRPYVAEMVENAKDDVRFYLNGGLPNLIINGEQVYQPSSEEFYKNIRFDRKCRNLFVFGCGLGFWYHKRQEEIIPNVFTMVFESNPAVLREWMKVIDATQAFLDKRIAFIVGLRGDELFEETQTILRSNHAALKGLLVSDIYEDATTRFDKKFYQEASSFLAEATENALSDFGNDIEDSVIGLENLLGNVKRTARLSGVNQYYGKYKGVPGIVVGAGPSLDKNKHLLKEWKGKAIIGSCDTAFPLLLKDGIVPDFVSSIERTPTTIKYYEGLADDPNITKTVFAPAAVIRPEIYSLCTDTYKMPTMAVFRDFNHFKWVPYDRGIIRSGKSATHLIFKMLVAMGCNPIILVGQDCAFAEDKTHASGADHSSEGMRKSVKMKHQMLVDGNNGGKLKTLRIWYNFKRTFEEYAVEHSDIEILNCTEGGAIIGGTKYMPLSDALKAYGGKDVVFEKPAIRSEQEVSADIEKIEINKKGTLNFLEKLSNDCDMLLEKNDGELLVNAVNSMINSEAFSIVMTHIVQSYYFWFLNKIESLKANGDTDEKKVATIKEFILAIKKSAKFIYNLFERV